RTNQYAITWTQTAATTSQGVGGKSKAERNNRSLHRVDRRLTVTPLAWSCLPASRPHRPLPRRIPICPPEYPMRHTFAAAGIHGIPISTAIIDVGFQS